MVGPERVIVIPALNEARTISSIVDRLSSKARVIVVDDGSRDDTAALAQASGAEVVRHPVNKGYEEAINSGFRKAREIGAKYLMTFDADGQHPTELIDRFYEPLEKGESDLVMGVRPSFARWSEALFGGYFRLRFDVQDPLCGMKAYRIDAFDPNQAFDSKKTMGAEILIAGAKRGLRMKQIPIPIRDREDQPRIGNVLRANYRILRALIKSI